MDADRVVIIILGKTGYGKSTWLTKYLQGTERKFVFDPFRKFPAEYLTEEELISRHESGAFKETPKFSIGTHVINDLSLIGSIAFLNGNCSFVIEECGFAFFKGERIEEWLQEAIFLGRHQKLSLIFTAQRAASIPIELRSQAARFISFRQTEKNDVQWCRDYLGEENFQKLPTLQKFECLDSDGESVTQYRIAALGN